MGKHNISRISAGIVGLPPLHAHDIMVRVRDRGRKPDCASRVRLDYLWPSYLHNRRMIGCAEDSGLSMQVSLAVPYAVTSTFCSPGASIRRTSRPIR